MLELNTFSIVAHCPRTGQLGVAVASAVPAVGAMCPYMRAGVGAVSTQSWVNPYLAIHVLDRLAEGLPAPDALAAALEIDDRTDLRQFGLVDARGGAAAWTGEACTGWAGQHTGEGYAVQGNMLAGPGVVTAMVEAFEASTDHELDERLMRALEAGDAAGGDKRGKQSAALRIVADQDYALLDLRVDEHATPVGDLRRILEVARLQLLPFVAGMPRRGTVAGPVPNDVVAMLLHAPAQRPGAPVKQALDLLTEVIGLERDPRRVTHLLAQFKPVLAEIDKLRALDLSDVHPPVVFDPSLPYL
ncbi:Uncharacterised protein [Starkeya nomas]|uniref:Uncharacterized protein n=1 Tax=Starkeya nomas TaxID=2666134 RepID=A0A5S9R511_9HYPH|nr:DUF1028 domain-containing protein [Starkeya nomas]CAA0128681.1 Uncharacterised protein [Starkeya nomas]